MDDEEIYVLWANKNRVEANYGIGKDSMLQLMAKAREDERNKGKFVCAICGKMGLGKSRMMLWLAEAEAKARQQERERMSELHKTTLIAERKKVLSSIFKELGLWQTVMSKGYSQSIITIAKSRKEWKEFFKRNKLKEGSG